VSRRSTPLLPGGRDGTSQQHRPIPALDPTSVVVDERDHADLLTFLRAFAEQLRFLAADGGELREAGSWGPLVKPEGNLAVSVDDIVAYMRDPSRFDGERARWLGRPHFALLLAFLELLGHARDHLNRLTRRHLDYYYRDVLKMTAEPAVPDRVAAVFQLAPRVDQLLLPGGTAVQAGRDASGATRVYLTERDLMIGRARVDSLRVVHVHRRVTGLPDVRLDRSLTPREIFERMLSLALGDPRPGEPIPRWRDAVVDLDLVKGLRPGLDFAGARLFLEHHELRTLMQLVRRRAAADAEWAEINRLLGLVNPPSPRDFAGNFATAVGVLDFETDGLPQVKRIDDLYEYRADPDVRQYIDKELAEIGYANFEALMPIKRRIDAEWAEINRILGRVGRRKRDLLAWNLEPADPTDFTANLAKALGDSWPPPWPWGAADIFAYESTVRQLEAHFAAPVERLVRLVELAESAESLAEADWRELDRLLADAHRENVYNARRARLAAARKGKTGMAAFDATVGAALLEPDEPMPWNEASVILARHLDRGQIDVLEHYRRQLVDPAVSRLFGWPDVDRVLELAQRYVEGAPEPVARKSEWRNLYAWDDVAALTDDPASPRWRTFGGRPRLSDETHPPTASLGWALQSPLLALSQGRRALTLTLGFREFDVGALLRALGLTPGAFDQATLRKTFAAGLKLEVTTAKGWVELPLSVFQLVDGAPGQDYWKLLGLPRALDEDRPAFQLDLLADASVDPFAPIDGTSAASPTLRITLRQRWDENAREWYTSFEPFDPLVLAAVHLRVDVGHPELPADSPDDSKRFCGLNVLDVQTEDRLVDPRKPFEPFGHQPAAGARLYLGHPELLRTRLDVLRLDIEWMALPPNLDSHYVNYGPAGITKSSDFKARLALVDRNLDLELADARLFRDDVDNKTPATASIAVLAVGPELVKASAGYVYTRRLDLRPTGDLRTDGRFLKLELTPVDFGHAAYPSLASRLLRKLSIGLGNNTITEDQAESYRIEQPYTPTIRRLGVAYRASIELDPTVAGDGVDRLLHVHPFGTAPIDHADPRLFPRYDDAGELYVGLRDVDAPQRLSLLMALAEGTSDPDLERTPVTWSILDGDRWRDLASDVLFDSTRGLINSGVVELAVPVTAPGDRLPGDRVWLRLAVARNPRSVCDIVAIHPHAAILRFDDRGNSPDHYDQPLPVGSIERLLDPDPRIVAVEQPYTSFGGVPPERPERFYTRVSERLRHKQRALTPWDYERLVLQRFGNIYKAKCITAGPGEGAGEPGRVDVVVIPDIRDQLPADAFAPRAPANVLADIQTWLAERSPPAARVVVRNPRYVAVSVRLGVRFKAGVDERYAKRRLNEDLGRFLSPWAYDDGAELTIGGKIYASSILDFVDRRDYVDYVAELKLARSDDGINFQIVPPKPEDYHVAADRPDQVLVAARDHHIDIIPELDYQQALFTGIDYMKLELDFIVG
jgi:hypothetical protein